MKKYRCYKVVEAAPIREIVSRETNIRGMSHDYAILRDGTPVTLPVSFLRRGSPQDGDYLVRYDEGYLSWSPKAVFEAGYAPLEE